MVGQQPLELFIVVRIHAGQPKNYMNKNPITVEITVKASILKVWEYWTKPTHIIHWAFAIETWEAPAAERDLRVGGRFKTTMAAKDRSVSFDITGTYTAIMENKLIEYDMDGGRHVKEEFALLDQDVKVRVTFDPENINSLERQRDGWQAILDNFKKYIENN